MGIYKKYDKSGKFPLNKFVIRAKSSVTGIRVVRLIKQALEYPGIYTFENLINVPSIQNLMKTKFRKYFHLLQIFSYGTYKDYVKNRCGLPQITQAQAEKLKYLTIISLSLRNKQSIPYEILHDELGIMNREELEDFINDAICLKIIKGRLDKERSILEVETAILRDINNRKKNKSRVKCESWCRCNVCQSVLLNLYQTQLDLANARIIHMEETLKVERQKYLFQKQCRTVFGSYGI